MILFQSCTLITLEDVVMKILVTGANGFVGRYIMKAVPGAEPVTNLRDRKEDIRSIFEDAGYIIHTAAISDTQICEKNPDESYEANVLLPVAIAKAAPRAKLICFSSDQVYNASQHDGPYLEGMECPGSVYARHKLEMEQRVLDINPGAVMLRLTWMFDMNHGYAPMILSEEKNIAVPEQYRGITWVREVADNIEKTFALPGGSYNFGSENEMPMPLFALTALAFLGRSKAVITENSRHNLWMNTKKAQEIGVAFSSSIEGFKKCVSTASEER